MKAERKETLPINMYHSTGVVCVSSDGIKLIINKPAPGSGIQVIFPGEGDCELGSKTSMDLIKKMSALDSPVNLHGGNSLAAFCEIKEGDKNERADRPCSPAKYYSEFYIRHSDSLPANNFDTSGK